MVGRTKKLTRGVMRREAMTGMTGFRMGRVRVIGG